MPQVLTTNALIVCPHGGVGTSVPSDPKWFVQGGAVLLENDTGTLACPFLPLPCVGYQLRSMGLNASQVSGRRVILVSDFNQSFTGLPLTMTEFHTMLDDSTPAPVPLGQDAPPLSPEMADTAKPTVAAVPPVGAFNSTTMQPATLPITFTLGSTHPLRWQLTLINEPLASHVDVTNGIPPGLVVAPAGGGWNSAVLVVTVTLTALFMAALGIGLHHLFMTGISQRGLSAYAKFDLTVS
ncbi:MAG: hypothetical protein U0Y68_25735 [Blastocatellia bacterium]